MIAGARAARFSSTFFVALRVVLTIFCSSVWRTRYEATIFLASMYTTLLRRVSPNEPKRFIAQEYKAELGATRHEYAHGRKHFSTFPEVPVDIAVFVVALPNGFCRC
jgi:hypothetical protein